MRMHPVKSVFAIGAAALACAVSSCAGGDSAQPKFITLSPDGARHIDIAYSPDGSRIAYIAPATGDSVGWQLWTAKADLTDAVALPITTLFNGNPPVWSPDGKSIAQTSNNFGTASAVVIPATGGSPRRVTQGPGVQLPIAWSRDGDHLAYLATDNATFSTRVVSLKSGMVTTLVPGEKRPHLATWSPDGTHLGIALVEGSHNTIWVADTTGLSPRQLTKEGFESFQQNVIPWSPDGKEILYESRRTGTTDLWVVPIDGSTPRQLTRDVRNDYWASWSSDGKWIAFISDRGHQTDVWVVPSAGGAQIRVTDTPNEELGPIWRPNTHELTFVMLTQKSSLWSRSLADGKEVQLTPDSIRAQWFNVSPDGKMVNYTVDRGGGILDLVVMPTAGGTPRTLVSGGGSVGSPRWSPDGTQIVFTSDRGGSQDVWVVDAAGGAPRQLVNWPGFEPFAAWSGDGSTIYFTSDHEVRNGFSDLWKVSPAGGEPVRVTHNGSLGGQVFTQRGVADVFVTPIGAGGQLAIARVGANGALVPVWDKTNAFFQAISPSGAEVAALVEQPDGKQRNMIISVNGGAGRVVLKPNEQTSFWSPDGKSVLVSIASAGANDLGIMNVADGSVKRLTTTPQSETGAEWSPDGTSIFFLRRTTVQRIVTTDLAKVLGAGK